MRKKAELEHEEKQKRRAKGKKELEAFMAARREEVQAAKQQKSHEEQEGASASSARTPEESWGLIVNNIALKEGDYPGTKNVAKMRQAILNQHNFLKKKKAANPDNSHI